MTTPSPDTSSKPRLLFAEPQLFVPNIEAATEFYATKLGFDVAFVYGDPPFYAQVVRDGARLNLRHVDGIVFAPKFRAAVGDALFATIVADDAGALYAEFEARGVVFHQGLQTEPWGARTFIVQDPAGNFIMFADSAK